MATKKILALLEEFQAGYETRNKDAVNSFVERLFVPGESAFALGTGSGELFTGVERVRQLISDDWEFWGDLRLSVSEARIGTEGDCGWFAVEGRVSRSFEDSAERRERYVQFVADKIKDESMSPKTRLALVNWVLSLTFSQRSPGKRDYDIPLVMSGSVQNLAGAWKFAHIHFALRTPEYPDERFEESGAFAKNYAEALRLAEGYAKNMMNAEIAALLRDFQGLSETCVDKDAAVIFLGPGGHQNPRLLGRLNLDIGKAIANHDGTSGWAAALGTLIVEKSDDTFFEDALVRLDALLRTDAPSDETLFAAHRLAASSLKEGSTGTTHTYPIRLTATISRVSGSWCIKQAHLSHPDYWLLEGKT
jgi:hypothetical protein